MLGKRAGSFGGGGKNIRNRSKIRIQKGKIRVPMEKKKNGPETKAIGVRATRKQTSRGKRSIGLVFRASLEEKGEKSVAGQ